MRANTPFGWPRRYTRVLARAIVPTFAAATACAQSAPAVNGSGHLLQQNQSLLAPGSDLPDPNVAPANASNPLARLSAQRAPTLHVLRFTLDDPLDDPLAGKVQQLFALYEGRDLTFDQITELRLELSTLLRKHMGVLVFAFLPEQDARDGTVRFAMVRGRVESLTLRNQSRVSDKRLARIFRIAGMPCPRPTRGTLELDDVQRHAAIARALPGVGSVTPVLSAGDTDGGTKILMAVSPDPSLNLALLADNGGSTASGRYRFGAQVVANSPFGLGDRARLVAYAAPGRIQDAPGRNGDTWIGLASYDLPVGYEGTRGGFQYSRVEYALGGPFRGLGDGYADVLALNLTHPIVLEPGNDMRVGLTLSHKQLEDVFFNYPFRRRSDIASFSLSGTHEGDVRGRRSILQYGQTLDLGNVRQVEQGLGEASTAGKFVKWNSSFDWLTGIWGSAYIRGRGSVQLASKHLDPAEQMPLGGPNAVRAYGYNAPSVDQGVIVSLDLVQPFSWLPGLSAKAFADLGRGQINKFAYWGAASNTWTALGYGFGLTFQYGSRVRIEVSKALRVGTPDGQNPSSSQTWANATMSF